MSVCRWWQSHPWTNWTRPHEVEMIKRRTSWEGVTTQFPYAEFHQERQCTRCGEVQIRVVEIQRSSD